MITALDIQLALWRDLQSANQLVMPNYTPKDWWECDVMSVTKAGFWTEFEIKLSVQDFRADRKKERRKSTGVENKHLALAQRIGCPNNFYYVVPSSIADKVVIPEWAGLMTAKWGEQDEYHDYSNVLFTSVRKKAPRLHLQKLNPEVLEHARGVCYWRMWSLKKHNRQREVRSC